MSFGRALDKFAEGFKSGVEAVDRHSYNRAATDRIRKPTQSEVLAETTPLEDGGGGTVTTSPSTSGGTTKKDDTKSTPAPANPTDTETVTKDDGTITSKGGSTDTLTGSAGGDTLSSGATGSNFGRNVYNYYVSKGLSPAAAAGFAGNFMQESGGAADVIAGQRKGDQGRSGYIGQWQGKRQQNLFAFAKDRGHDAPSLKDQLDFALEEGNPKSPYRDDVWAGKSHLLNSVKSPEEATALIRQFFERPSAQDLGSRTKYALQAAGGKGGSFTDIAGSGGGGGGGDTLVDSGPVGGTRPAGAIPDFMSGDDSGDSGDGGSRSAALTIQAPEVNTATPGYSGLPELDTDWAKVGFAEGGAIPDDNSFGWGAILNQGGGKGNLLASAGDTGAKTYTGSPGGLMGSLYGAGAGMTGQAGFNKPASPAAGAPAMAPVAYSRDRADATAAAAAAAGGSAPGGPHWQPNAPAPSQYQQQMEAYNAQVAVQAKQAAAAAAAQQAELDATATKKAAMDKAIKDAAAKKAATRAALLKKQNAKAPKLVNTADTALAADKAPDVQAIGQAGGNNTAALRQLWRKQELSHGGNEAGYRQNDRELQEFAKLRAIRPLTPAEQAQVNYLMQPGMQEGGVIPDPADPVTNFKKGGMVDDSVDDDGYFTRAKKAGNRDERFKQLLAEEERGGGRGGASGNARDRAARRLSVEEGRAPSTAYRPGGGGARREAAPARSGETRGNLPDKTDVKPKPRPDTVDDIVPVAAGTPTAGYEPSPARPKDQMWEEPPPNKSPARPKDQMWEEPPPNNSPQRDPSLMWPGATGAGTASPMSGRPDNVGVDVPSPVLPEPAGGDPADTTAATPPTTPPPADPAQPQQPAYGQGAKSDTLAATIVKKMPTQPEDTVVGDLQKRLREQGPPDNVGVNVPAPTVPADPRYTKWAVAAQHQLAAGRDPKEVAATLSTLGLPPEYWPQKLKDEMEKLDQPDEITPPIDTGGPYDPADLNKFLNFEKGGAIPDPEEGGGGGSFFAGVDNEAAAAGRTEKLQPTPKLMGHVAQAAHGGLQFLKQTFGMGGDGAIATPDDGAMRQSGARRMASGEGAATPDEIARTDQAIDPGGQLATHDKTMLRMAKTYQWYLEQGRKDEADAVAASLLQFGAQRTQHLGSIAAAAYSKYQQSGDPKDLDAAAGAIEEAYKYIPNGGNADISIGENGSLQVQHTDADGNTENVDIQPNEIGGLLRSAMDGSYYWGEIAKVADPKGYESRLTSERQAADDARSRREWDRQHGITSQEEKDKEARSAAADKEKFDYQHGITSQEEKDKEARSAAADKEKFDYQHGVTSQDELEKEKRAGEAELEKEKRTNLEEERRKLRDTALEEAKAAAKGVEPKSDAAALPGALSDASKAQIAYEADKTPENKQVLDASLARLLKAYGFDATKVTNLGYDLTGVDMGAEGPPVPGAELKYSTKQGKNIWVKDGQEVVTQ